MGTIAIRPVGRRPEKLWNGIGASFSLKPLLLYFLALLLLATFLAGSTSLLPISQFCPSGLVCVVIARFNPVEDSLSNQSTKTVAQTVKALLTDDSQNFTVQIGPSVGELSNIELARHNAQLLAQQTGAQFVIWGGTRYENQSQKFYVEVTDLSGIGHTTQIRPFRVQPLRYKDFQVIIECPTCDDDAVLQRLNIVAYSVAGFAHYAGGRPEKATDELLTALNCRNEKSNSESIADTNEKCFSLQASTQKSPLFYYYLGKSYILQGDYARAIKFFQEAISLEPQEPAPWIGIAQSYQSWLLQTSTPLATEPLQRAGQLLRKLQIQANPNETAQIYYDLGVVSELLGETKTAEDYYQKASEKFQATNVNSYEALLGLARIQEQNGDRITAEKTLQMASNLSSGSPWAKLALAQFYKQDRLKAETALQQASKSASNEAYVDITRADLCIYWQDYQCALQGYQYALKKRPDSGWLYGKIGDFYKPSSPLLPYQDWKQAEANYSIAAQKLRPNDPWSHERLAYTSFELGNYENALLHYQQAIQLAYPDAIPARLYCNLARTQEQLGLRKEANESKKRCETPGKEQNMPSEMEQTKKQL